MSEKYFVGNDLTGFNDAGKYPPVSRVTLLLDDENSITAGDDTGYEIVASCPHGTQAMANALLSRLSGYRYQAYTADAANIDPAAELGDGVDVGGVYGVISRLSDDGSGYSGLTAPGEATVDEEYPSGPMQAEFSRKIAETNSKILKTAEEITLRVDGVAGSVSSLSVRVDGISSTVSTQGGQISTLQQTASSLTARVSNAETGLSQTVRLAADGITITNAAGSTLKIDGGQLKAKSVTATEIDADDLHVKAANVDGTLKVGALYGATVNIYDSREVIAARIEMDPSTSGEYVSFVATNSNNKTRSMSLETENGLLYLISTVKGDTAQLLLAGLGYAELSADFRPMTDDHYMLGRSFSRWQDLYLINEPDVSSDRNMKKDIVYDMAGYEALFDALRPCHFRFINGHDRIHTGLISQDVEESLPGCGLTSMDFAGFIKSEREDEPGAYDYALRYGEFISLLIDQVQKLKRRVAALEEKA